MSQIYRAGRTRSAEPGKPVSPQVSGGYRQPVTETQQQPKGEPAPLVEQVGAVLGSVEDVEEYLTGVVHLVAEATAGCDAVGVTVVSGERPFTAAYTTATTLAIDAVQYALDEGPCLEAHRTRSIVRADLDEASERWPAFTAAAADFETRALIALPLTARDGSVGSLNLYARSTQALDAVDLPKLTATASRVGEVVAAGLAVVEARQLAGQLEEAMASRAVIEQAKGVLMGKHGLSETEAFDLMRLQSQRSNVKLRTIAARVVEEATGRPAAAGQAAHRLDAESTGARSAVVD